MAYDIYQDINLQDVGQLIGSRQQNLTTIQRNDLGLTLSADHNGLFVWDVDENATYVWDGLQWTGGGGQPSEVNIVRQEYHVITTDANGEATIPFTEAFTLPHVVATTFAKTVSDERQVSVKVIQLDSNGVTIKTSREGLGYSLNGVVVTSTSVGVSTEVHLTITERNDVTGTGPMGIRGPMGVSLQYDVQDYRVGIKRDDETTFSYTQRLSPRLEHHVVTSDVDGNATVTFTTPFTNPHIALAPFAVTVGDNRQVSVKITNLTTTSVSIQTTREGLGYSLMGMVVTSPSVVVPTQVHLTVTEIG